VAGGARGDPVLEGFCVKKLSIMTMESPRRCSTRRTSPDVPEYTGVDLRRASRKSAPARLVQRDRVIRR